MAARLRTRLPWIALAAAMAAAVALYLYWGRGETFFADEWNFMINRRPWDAHTLLYPQAGHLSLVPVLIYKAMFGTLGADDYLPYRLVAIGATLAVAVLFFLLVRRRVGDWPAVGATVLLLFLGSSWEVLMASFGLNTLLGLAAGLGVLLCLDRGDLRGDVGACGLLALSLATFSIGLVFALATAVELWISRVGTRFRRAWVYLLPLALYGGWALWARQFDQSTLSASNIDEVPHAVGESLGALAGSVTGLFKDPRSSGPGEQLDIGVYPVFGVPVAVLVGLAIAFRLRRGPAPSARFWSLAAMFAAYWVLIALSLKSGRAPNSPRYMLPGAVLLFLLLAELWRGVQISRGWGLAGLAVLALSLAFNVPRMEEGGRFFRIEAQYNRAALGALELAANRVDPVLQVEPPSVAQLPHGDLYFYPYDYFAAAASFGTPAFSAAEIARSPAYARAYTDLMLARLLPVGIERPASHPRSVGSPAITVARVSDGSAVRRGRCAVLRPAGGEPRLSLLLTRGGFAYQVPRKTEATVALRRFGTDFTVRLTPVRGPGLVRIPTDRSDRPWLAVLVSRAPLTACPA